MTNYLSESCKIVQLSAAVEAGTSTIETDGVDTLGFAGCLFVCVLGTAASNNVISIKQSADDSSYAALAGASQASGTKAVVLLDIQNSGERYLRASIARGTSSTIEGVLGLLYNPVEMPVDNSASALAKAHAPAEA